jgi:hypothetical protein
MYHPAAALHQGSLRPVIVKDFAQIPELIAKAAHIPEYQQEAPEDKQDPKQLSMF